MFPIDGSPVEQISVAPPGMNCITKIGFGLPASTPSKKWLPVSRGVVMNCPAFSNPIDTPSWRMVVLLSAAMMR
jgi:hypothetical protein